MRSAGCIINDMWDRNLDRQVERTKNRPLASGKLSMLEASGLLTTHLTAGLGVLYFLNPMAIFFSFYGFIIA